MYRYQVHLSSLALMTRPRILMGVMTAARPFLWSPLIHNQHHLRKKKKLKIEMEMEMMRWRFLCTTMIRRYVTTSWKDHDDRRVCPLTTRLSFPHLVRDGYCHHYY